MDTHEMALSAKMRKKKKPLKTWWQARHACKRINGQTDGRTENLFERKEIKKHANNSKSHGEKIT